jgi:hypothetical protein
VAVSGNPASIIAKRCANRQGYRWFFLRASAETLWLLLQNVTSGSLSFERLPFARRDFVIFFSG